MNYDAIYRDLTGQNATKVQQAAANTYIAYLRKLEREQKKDNGRYIQANPWMKDVSDQLAIDLFRTVEGKGLYIDGDTVLIQKRGGAIVPDYTYKAYKNLVKVKYPDTTFDFGIVYQGDTFTFRKESGRVLYQHVFGDPFQRGRQIIGAYGIIKNTSGEFIETINIDDIMKFKNISSLKSIWDSWFDRMVLKSVIKRICHISFSDIVKEIEAEDNENNDLDLVNVACEIQTELAECKTVADVLAFYNKYRQTTKNMNELTSICKKRKTEILQAANNGMGQGEPAQRAAGA